eukprot:scaffold16547_cov73-Phaeocystis_antarctica.AAC.2
MQGPGSDRAASVPTVHTWMVKAAPCISYDSPSLSTIQSSDGIPPVPVGARATLKRVDPGRTRIVHAIRAARGPRVIAAKGHVDIAVVVGEVVPRRGACGARDLEQKVALYRGPQVERRDEGRPRQRGPCPVLYASGCSIVRDNALGAHPAKLEAVGRVEIE